MLLVEAVDPTREYNTFLTERKEALSILFDFVDEEVDCTVTRRGHENKNY